MRQTKKENSFLKLFIFIVFSLSLTLWANSKAEKAVTLSPQKAMKEAEAQSAQDCIKISSSLYRLNCFDKIFKTPINYIRQTQTRNLINNWQQSKDKRVSFLRRHLSMKGIKHSSGLTFYSYEKEAKDQENRLILSVIASTAIENKKEMSNDMNKDMPALIFQCHQDISSVQLLWPNNLDTDQIDIRIWSHEKLLLDSTWHVLDEAFLLTSPRGLPGIRIIKRLFNNQQITIESKATKLLFKATFNINQLEQQMIPLAKACHWL